MIEAQAARYVARVSSGEITESELQGLESWLAADARHPLVYEKMWETWGQVAELDPDLLDDDENLSFLTVFRNQFSARKLAVIAAVALAFLGVMFSYKSFNTAPNAHIMAYKTAVGEQRIVTLPDDSIVTLNTGTQINVQFGPAERRLKLAYGEAFFDISKDPSRPFIVEMDDHVITVLGTKFNVLRNGPDVMVVVVEGIVTVDDKGAASSSQNSLDLNGKKDSSLVVLKAGSVAKFSLKSDKIVKVAAVEIDLYHEWRHGFMRFESQPLVKVISELNRYSHRKILIEDDRVMDMEFSGVIRMQNIATTLSGLDEALPIEVIEHPDRFVIVGAEDELPLHRQLQP